MLRRIIVAADMSIARRGIVTMLAQDPELQVIAEVENGLDAVTACRDLQPDLILLALRQPPRTDVAVTRLLASDQDAPRILLLGEDDDTFTVEAAIEAGATGFLPITVGDAELHDGIERALAGEPVIPEVSVRAAVYPIGLGLQEQLILSKVARGLPNKAIAQQLGISVRTVGHHMEHIFRKLGASNRTEAVLLARQYGLLRNEWPSSRFEVSFARKFCRFVP